MGMSSWDGGWGGGAGRRGREALTLCCPSWGSTGRCIGGVCEAGEELSDANSEREGGTDSGPPVPVLLLPAGEAEFCLFMRARSSTCQGCRELRPGRSRAAALFSRPVLAPGETPSGLVESLLELCTSHCGDTYLPGPGGFVGGVCAAVVVVQGLLLLLLLLIELLLLLQGLQVGVLLLQLALEPLRLALLLQLLPLVLLDGQRRGLSFRARGSTRTLWASCRPPGPSLPAAEPVPGGAAAAESPAAAAPPLTCA